MIEMTQAELEEFQETKGHKFFVEILGQRREAMIESIKDKEGPELYRETGHLPELDIQKNWVEIQIALLENKAEQERQKQENVTNGYEHD